MSLIYNGISFVYPRTEVHIMGPEKDPSGTDQMFTTIRIKAASLLYVNSFVGLGLPPAIPGVDFNTGQLVARIRHMLTTPRRPLYYDFLSTVGTTNGLPPSAIINLPDGLDDANGPWPDPDAFQITYTTPDCLEVTWACTVKLRDCGFNGVTNEPLSLRWEDSLTWDKYFKATYQRVGTAIISSRSGFKIDKLRRQSIAPICPPGFHRKKSSYTCSRDGLRCDFAFIDEQVRYTPPYPAVEMEIIQSETFPLLGGMRIGQVEVSMVGIQNANVRDLALWGLTVAKARVWAANPLQTANGTVVNGSTPPILRTRETNEGVDISVVIPYKSPPKKNREKQDGGGLTFWGGLAGGVAGFFIGGPAGALIGAGVGALAGNLATPTKEGKDPTPQPVFPWLGACTTPAGPQNPPGYATWANVTGQIVAPADGVGLAPAVSLFAALLQDPCGAQLSTTPFAGPTDVTLRTNVNIFNTELGGGQGGTSSIYPSQLVASISGFNAAQYPSLPSSSDETSLYEFDEEPGVYDYWQCVNQYLDDPGAMVLPTCNPDGLNIKIRHSSHMVTLRKRWAASRTGSQPKLPPRDIGDTNWVYVGGMTAPEELKVAPDGVSVCYVVSGIYEYQALDASKVKMDAEIPPFLSASQLQDHKGWVQGIVELRGGPSVPVRIGTGGSGAPLGSVQMLNSFPN